MRKDDHPILPVHTPTSSRPPSPSHDDVIPAAIQNPTHIFRSSASSSLDSQHDIPTAVNTPYEHTPYSSKRDLRLKSEKTEDGLDSHHKGVREEGVDEIRRETKIRRWVSDHGEKEHPGSDGGQEGTMTVDLGNGLEEVIMIDWAPDDPGNPFNWSVRRKYAITLVAVLSTALTAGNATSVAIMSTWGTEWFSCSREQFTLTLTVYMMSIAVTPLGLAPLSEVFGRNWIYQITSILNAILFIPQALSPSYSGLIAARWFQGMAASVGNSMVGGTIADLFHAESRGLAMNVFAIVIFTGQAYGSVAMGWVGMYWGIQWCYGIQGILACIPIVLNALILRETRGDVLLSRRARRLTKSTGKKHVCAADLGRQGFVTLMRGSIIRPLQYLVTEPIVSALSAWIAFAWGCIFLSGSSTLLVFSQYGFNYGQQGSILAVVGIGGAIGFVSNFHQEHLYHKAAAKSPNGRAAPEVRLYWAATGGLMFPIAMYIFAWTGQPNVPWAIPAVILIFSNWGIYCMYSGVFNYLADAYETYSSSAQAAQSFARNVASGVVPLFGHQMYEGMGYPQATTLLASVALVLSAAPILLIIYGSRLRAKSKVASALAANAQ